MSLTCVYKGVNSGKPSLAKTLFKSFWWDLIGCNKKMHVFFSPTLLLTSTFYSFSKPNVTIQRKQIELLQSTCGALGWPVHRGFWAHPNKWRREDPAACSQKGSSGRSEWFSAIKIHINPLTHLSHLLFYNVLLKHIFVLINQVFKPYCKTQQNKTLSSWGLCGHLRTRRSASQWW